MADSHIITENLSKRYGSAPQFALNRLNVSIAAGEVYGFLGSNGAGKSTTIRTLLGFLKPTSGSAQICGLDSVRDSVEVKKHVGYLAGDVALYTKVTGQEFLDFMATLQPVKHRNYVDTLIKNLDADLTKPLESLSKGNRQKIGILQAFMHEPDVLILDEPTSGLDPLMQEVFFDAVRDAKTRGASVFFSSHNLAEVQRICDRVGFIREGKLVSEQKIAELSNGASHTFDIEFTAKAPMKELRAIPNATVMTGTTPESTSIVVPVESLSNLFGVLASHKVAKFQQRELNLEDEFMNFYREDEDHVSN